MPNNESDSSLRKTTPIPERTKQNDFAAPSATTIGARLRRLRRQQALSIRELAEKAGVDKGTVVRIEHGQRHTYETLAQICQALSVHIARVMQTEEEETVSLHTHAQTQWLRHSEVQKGASFKDTLPSHDTEAERAQQALEGEAVFFYLLKCTLPDGAMFGSVLELWAESRPRTHPGQEFVYCIQGSACLKVAGREYVLQQGEAATFWSAEPHSYAPSAEAVRANKLPVRILCIRNDTV